MARDTVWGRSVTVGDMIRVYLAYHGGEEVCRVHEVGPDGDAVSVVWRRGLYAAEALPRRVCWSQAQSRYEGVGEGGPGDQVTAEAEQEAAQ